MINKLQDETVSYESNLGFYTQFAENLRISIEVETEFYKQAVAWLHDLVYGAKFDVER